MSYSPARELGAGTHSEEGEGRGVFRRWCARGGDTALCLCESGQAEGVTLPCGPHASVLLFPMSYSTVLIDLSQL